MHNNAQRRSENIARHEAANRQSAADAVERKAARRVRHETHVDAQRRGRAARSLQRDYERLLARSNKTDADFDEVMMARDAADNERVYLDYR